MSKQKTTRAKTSRSLPIFIADTSSTTGGGLSGVTSASSGLVLEYRRQNQSTWTSVTPQSGKTLGTYFSGGIVASGALAGRYEVDFPDAAFASAAGVEWVEFCVRGVANMLPVLIEIELDAVDYQDAAAFGLSKFADIETDTQNIQTRIPAALVDGRIAANAQIVGDKEGYKLASDGLALVTAWTVGITGNLTGNVTGSVGSISGVTFPTHFSSLGITVGGAIAELGANALQANDLYTPISQAVWNALTTTTWVSDSFGKHILISNNNNRSVQVTGAGSGHIAADIHALQAGVITSAAFSANWFTAAGLAADAVGEIADGVWDEATSGHTTAGTTGKALIDSGAAGNPWSTDLATGYSGTQAGNILNEVKAKTDTITGNQTINVYPVSASTPERVAGTTITYYRNEIRSVSVVTDFTLTSLTLSLTIEDAEGTDLLTIANGSISRSGQTFTVSIGTAVTASVGNKRWALRDITGGTNSVIARGVFSVQEAASA